MVDMTALQTIVGAYLYHFASEHAHKLVTIATFEQLHNDVNARWILQKLVQDKQDPIVATATVGEAKKEVGKELVLWRNQAGFATGNAAAGPHTTSAAKDAGPITTAHGNAAYVSHPKSSPAPY